MDLLAYYLPQFHQVPENDQWWGEGFTEWTAAKNAKPLYEGHYQPHEPWNDNYYNLLEKETMKWQAKLMHRYSIDGMCFYHYWFGEGQKILERPAENLLKWTDIDMPFCFSWANQSWVQAWSNLKGFSWMSESKKEPSKKESSVIFQQKYGREEEWEIHFRYLLPFFKDKRYIRYEGKPLFVIHVLKDVPCLYEMARYWEKLAKENGLEGLYIIGGGQAGINYGVDAVMTHEPGDIKRVLRNSNIEKEPTYYSYREAYERILAQKYPRDIKMIYTSFCSYDTTPRYGRDGCVFQGGSPEIFEEYLTKLMAKNAAVGMDLFFIDAWNEWGEGMHLEPDKKYGFRWLEAVQRAKERYKDYIPDFAAQNNYMSMEEHVLRRNSSKYEMYLNTLSDWMHVREKKKNIASFFKKYKLEKILIYGYGIFARHLISECNELGISVAGVIDQNPPHYAEGISTYKISEKTLPDGDAIIVTSFYYMSEICTEIRKYNSKIPIYSINEIIYEMLSV